MVLELAPVSDIALQGATTLALFVALTVAPYVYEKVAVCVPADEDHEEG